MPRLTKLAALALLSAFLALPTTGCAAVASLLPTVIAAVTDAALILDQIEDYMHRYFAANPNPEKEKQVFRALGKCRGTLIVAQRTSQGAHELDQQKVDAAFTDFKAAYTELTALLDGVPGLRVQRPGDGPMLAAGPDQLILPPPIAMGPAR
jgi:hypothetical protein